MTTPGYKDTVVPSKVLEKVIKAKAVGLESLGCIIPKISHQNADDAATETNATMFPLKESYRKNTQYPHSQSYWDKAAKDYRHESIDEMADENNRVCIQDRPKMRSMTDMPSRAQFRQYPQQERKEVRNITIHQCDGRYEGEGLCELRERDQLDDPDSPHHDDAHYNAILNVEEDEDLRKNFEKSQSHRLFATRSIDSRLRTDYLFQEYLRLMAICEKHEEMENTIRKARMSITEAEQDWVTTQPLSLDLQQTAVESSVYMTNNADSDEWHHPHDPFSVSNLTSPATPGDKAWMTSTSSKMSSRGALDFTGTSPNDAKETRLRSPSFDGQWGSLGDNRSTRISDEWNMQNPFTSACHAESSLSISQGRIDFEPITVSRKLAGIAAPSGCKKSCGQPLSSSLTERSTNDSVQKLSRNEKPLIPMGENGLMSKITVINSHHSLDPIYVSCSPSPTTQDKDKSCIANPSPRLYYNKSESVGITAEKEKMASIVGARQEHLIESISSTSLEPLGRSTVPFNRAQSNISRNPFQYTENQFSRKQHDADSDYISEILWQKKRELLAASSIFSTVEESLGSRNSIPHGSSSIESKHLEIKSEHLGNPGRIVRPITPSPTARSYCTDQLEISHGWDVQCEKGKELPYYEADPFIPAYSDSVIIGRPISPEKNNRYANREYSYGTIAGLSPVTCSGSQFRNSIFPGASIQGRDQWRDESVDCEPIERSNVPMKVQHLSATRDVRPQIPHPELSSYTETCMPLFNKQIRSVVDRYKMLKESSKQISQQRFQN